MKEREGGRREDRNKQKTKDGGPRAENRGPRTEDRGATRETREILLTSPSGPSRCETVPRLYVHGRIAWLLYRDTTVLPFLPSYFSRVCIFLHVQAYQCTCMAPSSRLSHTVMHACAFTSFGSVFRDRYFPAGSFHSSNLPS